ncbi:MAG: alpha/beta fold hydrolase [Rhodococcus sp. (in: high G+C Gram-positive bacteria)]
MPRSTIAGFENTTPGADFYRSYDTVLSKWPAGTAVSNVDSEFGSTRITSFGVDDGQPVILLAGGGATSTVWFGTAAALGGQFRVHAVDVMGDVGRSVPRGRGVTSTPDLLDWIDTVFDGLGLSSSSIVGHSYGAMIALAYALRSPDAVSRLIMLDPNQCFASMSPQYLLRALPVLVRPTERRWRSFLDWETGRTPLDDDWTAMSALGAAHFPTTKTIVPRRPSPELVAKLPMPTTVVLARHSKVHNSESVASAVRSVLPAANVETIADATHHSLPLEPAVNSTILRALTY